MDRVYFDESGDFDDPRERCAIGGLRISDDSAAFDRSRWIDALAHTVPWVPWPPHATHVRNIGCHMLWLLADGRRRARAPAEPIQRAYELLDPSTRVDVDSLVERLVEAPSRATAPMHDVADRVRKVVQRDKAVCRFLTEVRDHAVREVVGLTARAVARVRHDRGTASFIGAAEDVPGDGSVSPDPRERDGRFRSLLAVALHRLRCIRDHDKVTADRDSRVIEVVICRRSKLVAADVTKVIHRIYPPGARIPTAPCPMRAARPVDCNASSAVPPSVISDWLANRLGHVVRRPRIERRSLREVLEDTLDGFGLLTDAADPSPLAATQTAVCRWAREQAEGRQP